MESSIARLMTKEHKSINDLFVYFEKSLEEENLKHSRALFSKFSWILEKHFFVEEKVIFGLYNNNEDLDIKRLLDEHKMIIRNIERIGENLNSDDRPGISELKRLLEEHSRFENTSLYPRFDKELNPEEKWLMIERAQEIIG